MLITAVSLMLTGGTVIICGKLMGQNRQDELQSTFSLNIIVSSIIAGAFVLFYLIAGVMDLTGFVTHDNEVRPIFNQYLLGQAIGVFPLLLGNQLSSFLTMELKTKRTIFASVAYILANLVFSFLFVKVFKMEAFGIALASSLGLWVFFGIQAQHFLSQDSYFRFSSKHVAWRKCGEIVRIGFPGAISNGYQTVRGIVVNRLIEIIVGSVGISAFATSDNLLRIIWAVPTGMLAVSRLLMSVSIGEEDRQTLADVMRVMFRRYLPLLCTICAAIIICAEPLTRIFYHDPSDPVYMMTVWGFRILPLCMPLSTIYMHFVCYAQATNRQLLVHVLSALDGVICVVAFTALLIRAVGMNSVYIANVLNGVVTTIVIIGFAWYKKKHFPKDMDELMVIPDDFGVPEDERIDITVRSMEEVVSVSRRVQEFCREKGIDERRAYLASLSMEEMAGNVLDHGFTKDKKPHNVDIRVVHKDDDVILRIKDDCVAFDPGERRQLTEGDDPAKNIGIRMIYRIADDIQYQNILGLNVLTIRI
jgi:Na+-driven multidrug efflux pump/anti-sigma regulatory factor (Ser/Thr protein kinase)